METQRLQQSLWDRTREGVQRQLAEATERAEAGRVQTEQAIKRSQQLEDQSDALTHRIIELERQLYQSSENNQAGGGVLQPVAAGKVSVPSRHPRLSSDTGGAHCSSTGVDRDIREYVSRINELQSQLHITDCQSKIDVSKMRQQLRQNSALVALAKTEAAECKMMMDLYRFSAHPLCSLVPLCLIQFLLLMLLNRDKVVKLKAQKKVLVGELRGLRDLGIYEGRITVDHAPPAAPASSFAQQITCLDASIKLDSSSVSELAHSHAMAIMPEERPERRTIQEKLTKKSLSSKAGGMSEDVTTPPQFQEKGINFSVLKVCH